MICTICAGKLESLGYVPFDKNNADIPIVDVTPIEYVKCSKCYNITCPEMISWSSEKLGATVYNDEYVKYDPDYANGERAKDYGRFIKGLLPAFKDTHLDYGSGAGSLSKELGWKSANYDPFSGTTLPEGIFKFITLIEVVEHSPDVVELFNNVIKYLDKKRGVIMISTCLATKDTDITWPYIAPRNGHINIQTQESMKLIASKHNMFFNSITENIHFIQSTRNNFKDIQRGMRW